MTPLHHGQYVHLDVLPTGGLRVTLTQEAGDEIALLQERQMSDDGILHDLLNESCGTHGMMNNGGPLFVTNISEVDGGHLSQAPAIIDSWRYNDPDEVDHNTIDGVNYLTDEDSKVWYWSYYQIVSILEHIERQGEAVLTQLT